MQEPNVIKLQELAKGSETSKAVFQYFASRQRQRSDMDVRRLRYRLMEEGAQIEEKELFGLFKELEKLDLGRVVSGRGGKVSRFVWKSSIKDIGSVALNGKTIITKVRKALRVAPRIHMSDIGDRPSYVTVKKDDIEINVPLELSPSDFAKVIDLVQNLSHRK